MPARAVTPKHLDLGQRGEDAAAQLLCAKGWTVRERNLRLGRLELDLVCEDGDTLVFVEVKARGAGALGTPADGLTPQKCARLLRAARQYLSRHSLWSRPCRFDLVAVCEGAGGIEVQHMENVLSAEDILTQGNRKPGGASGSWQPW